MINQKLKLMRIAGVAATILGLSACATSGGDVASDTGADQVMAERALFSPERIRADVTFLADDLLRGRDTGSEGHRIAANYVAAEFARLGLKPAGENGGYYQEVPFQTAQVLEDGGSMSITVGGETRELTMGDEFFMSGSVKNPAGEVSADLVFVGFGVHAPDVGHDDFAGLDLEGKIAVAINGAPSSFNTETRAHHGSNGTKGKALNDRGAVGLITLNTLAGEKSRPFSRLKRFIGFKSFDWVVPEGDEAPSAIKIGATISHDVARQLFEGAEADLDTVLKQAEEGAPSGFVLKTQASMKRDSTLSEKFDSPNVLAVLEGSDPTLKDEYVVLTAHLDHIGVNSTDAGETINNGALDNASGVSILLEVARAYVRENQRPRRSILFTIVTAEEKGLLGAEYFVHYPTVSKSQMVANVNVDMPILLYDFTDMVAFGAERSSLGPITEQALAKIGVSLSPDPMPEQGIFTRSDHYRFVQKGVPSVFLVTGWGEGVSGKDGGAIFRQFLGSTYHSPGDNLGQSIDYAAGAKFAHANWLIASAIANGDARPTWNEGDFFGDTFGAK